MCGVVVRCAGEPVVVEGLTVVRVGSRFQQETCELDPVGMWGLVGFTSTERPGERSERWHEAPPQEAGVRVRARIEQHRRRCQRRVSLVAEVES